MSQLLQQLRRSGVVEDRQLDMANRRQQIYGGSLDTVLLEMGLLTAPVLRDQLALASGLPAAPSELLVTSRERPWDRVPADLVDLGWIMPLALDGGGVLVAVHPELPDDELARLRRTVPGIQPHVAPECCLAAIAAERSGSVVQQRYAVLSATYIQRTSAGPSAADSMIHMTRRPEPEVRGPAPAPWLAANQGDRSGPSLSSAPAPTVASSSGGWAVPSRSGTFPGTAPPAPAPAPTPMSATSQTQGEVERSPTLVGAFVGIPGGAITDDDEPSARADASPTAIEDTDTWSPYRPDAMRQPPASVVPELERTGPARAAKAAPAAAPAAAAAPRFDEADLERRVAPLRATLAATAERDAVTDALLKAAAQICPKVALFGVKREGLRGLSGAHTLADIAGTLIEPGEAMDAALSGKGAIEEAKDIGLRIAVRAETAVPCLFEVVRVRERAVLVLYADREGARFEPAEREVARDLCAIAGAALERVLSKLRGESPAPGPSGTVETNARANAKVPAAQHHAAATPPALAASAAGPASAPAAAPLAAPAPPSLPAIPARAPGDRGATVRAGPSTSGVFAKLPLESAKGPAGIGPHGASEVPSRARAQAPLEAADVEPSASPAPPRTQPAAHAQPVAPQSSAMQAPAAEPAASGRGSGRSAKRTFFAPPPKSGPASAAGAPATPQMPTPTGAPAAPPASQAAASEAAAARRTSAAPASSTSAAAPSGARLRMPTPVSIGLPPGGLIDPHAAPASTPASTPPANAPAGSQAALSGHPGALTLMFTGTPGRAASPHAGPTSIEVAPPEAIIATAPGLAPAAPAPAPAKPNKPASPPPAGSSGLAVTDDDEPIPLTQPLASSIPPLRSATPTVTSVPSAQPAVHVPSLLARGPVAAGPGGHDSLELTTQPALPRLVAEPPPERATTLVGGVPALPKRSSGTPPDGGHAPEDDDSESSGSKRITEPRMPSYEEMSRTPAERPAELDEFGVRPARPLITVIGTPPPPTPPPPPTFGMEAGPRGSTASVPGAAPKGLPSVDLIRTDQSAGSISGSSLTRAKVLLDDEDRIDDRAGESLSARIDDCITRSMRGSASSTELETFGDSGVLRLIARFPGPLDVLRRDLDNLPPPSAHGGLLRVCIAMGARLTPHLIELLDHGAADVRFYAAFIFQELRDDRCVSALGNHAFDADADLRTIAMRVLETYARAPDYPAAVAKIRAELSSENAARQLYATRAVGTLRDVASVPRLIELLSSRDRATQESALESLCSITGQQLGLKPHRWRAWHSEHGQAHRVEWIMAGLEHADAAVRRWCLDELRRITGQSIAFPVTADKPDRDAALAQWRAWWQSARPRA